MRLAYLVTAYRAPLQVHRLCARLRHDDPSAVVLLQIDRCSPDLADLAANDVSVRCTDQPVRWGDASYSSELLQSMKVLLDEQWDWMVLISGQDFPVRPARELHTLLSTTSFKAFAPGATQWSGTGPIPDVIEDRYLSRFWFARRGPAGLHKALGRLGSFAERLSRGRVLLRTLPRAGGTAIGLRRRRHPFGPSTPCHFGPDYFILRRDVVQGINDFLDLHPDVLGHFMGTFVPSEALFASVTRWVARDGVSEQRLHFMQFAGKANPRRITPSDVPELLASGVFFARKFDDDDGWVEVALPPGSTAPTSR